MNNLKKIFMLIVPLFFTNCHAHNVQKSICVTIYNHTPSLIAVAQINGVYVGNSNAAYSGGGGNYCGGPAMPKEWYEGLTVKVKWAAAVASEYENGAPEGETMWKEKEVAVPYYPTLDLVFVNFFPNDDVKVDVRDSVRAKHNPYPDPIDPPGFIDAFGGRDYNHYQCENIKLPPKRTINECIKRREVFEKTGVDIMKGRK